MSLVAREQIQTEDLEKIRERALTFSEFSEVRIEGDRVTLKTHDYVGKYWGDHYNFGPIILELYPGVVLPDWKANRAVPSRWSPDGYVLPHIEAGYPCYAGYAHLLADAAYKKDWDVYLTLVLEFLYRYNGGYWDDMHPEMWEPRELSAEEVQIFPHRIATPQEID